MEKLTEVIYTGKEMLAVIKQLGELRIRVFHEFPYLYEGNQDYEEAYLKNYAQSDQSVVFCLFSGNHLVGACTGMPLEHVEPTIQEPFLEAKEQLADYYYFGESILLPEYRGRGLGHRFFDIREQHANKLGYKYTVFCSVDRADNHPLKPATYVANNQFWEKRGYSIEKDKTCSLSWLDRENTEETSKSLQFWKKTWR